jgi:hypothetical protein
MGETGFVIERRVAGSSNPWTVRATVKWPLAPTDPGFANAAGKGARSYVDTIGNIPTLYEYQVYAINTVGDTWDYSNPALNEIPLGGGFPTLTLDSRGVTPPVDVLAAPSNLTATAAIKNNRTATVTLNWVDNSTSETGFTIQRADNAAFSVNVVNANVGPNVTTFQQDVARNKTFYYRVLAFNNTTQSGWSNTVNITTP